MAIALSALSAPPLFSILRARASHEATFGRWALLLPVAAASGVWFAAEGPTPALPSLTLAASALALSLVTGFGLARSARFALFAPLGFALAAFLAGVVSLTFAADRQGPVVLTKSTSAALTGRIVTV
ncbi:MAG: hypothetical protein AAGF49_16000, partial [Pseudomonadota bacterium]